MAVRKLKKSYQNVTGRFYSTLLNRLVQFDSRLERDFILLLDMHPVVRWFAEQPMKIRFTDESGVQQVYVPDFLITFHGGRFLGRKAHRPWIVETKYCSGHKDKLAEDLTEAPGWSFRGVQKKLPSSESSLNPFRPSALPMRDS